MISNKTLATLFIIILNMQLAVSSGIQKTGSSGLQKRKQRHVPSAKENMLRDMTSTVNSVEIQGGSIREMSVSLEQSASQTKNQFEELIEQGNYDDIERFGRSMSADMFLEEICPVVKTFKQYKGIVGYLKSRNLVASFYVYGDIEVVKGAIAESRVNDDASHYFKGGDLESALPLALEKDCHDRFIKLLDIRKGITSEKDKRRKQDGWTTSFGYFGYHFLRNLAPWKDGVTLRRFLALRGEELRTKYPDILDILCYELVDHLHDKLRLPKAEGLLIDLIGQPSLLTPVAFARIFLYYRDDRDRSNFIKYGWRETIQEGLKTEYKYGGKELWRVMQGEKPDQFPGQFPDTEEARTAACAHLPTKQEKEEEWIKNNEKWIKKNALMLYAMIKGESISGIFPGVLWSIIFEYALSLIATWNLTTSTE